MVFENIQSGSEIDSFSLGIKVSTCSDHATFTASNAMWYWRAHRATYNSSGRPNATKAGNGFRPKIQSKG
jgi:hypothetical protein